jgi:ribosomal protein S18 acetylase RimI-like enzyme
MTRMAKFLADIRTFPADAALGYRHEGLRGAWKALAARTLHRVVRTGRLVVFAHPVGSHTEDTALPQGVRIARATEQDVPALSALVGQREVIRFHDLIASGRHCLIAWRDEQPVGYTWVSAGIGPDVSLWPLPFQFPSDAAYLWNLYVLPSERSSGIGTALARARLQLARELGFREGWRMVAPTNRASLRTVQKSGPPGTRVIGELNFVQLLGRTWGRFRPHAASSAGTT